MDAADIREQRRNAVWISPQDADVVQFESLISAGADRSQWPLAAEVISNVLIYDGDAVRAAASDAPTANALTAEWAQAFSIGPGVLVIRNAIVDHTMLDRATAMFNAMIEAQHRSGTGGGDHFAKPGANDRIWNSLQKHCLAEPQNFADYYASDAIALASLAWLGPNYQMTAQVNRVNPGGAAQSAHRDYHLGFMSTNEACQYPTQVHALSPLMTLQGAIAHTDMPVESGPTMLLPYSQNYPYGYIAFPQAEFQDVFRRSHVQLPLAKGDALFFNPALMHAAGSNRTENFHRMANLLQISSAFGRAMESVDRLACAKAVYPALQSALATGKMVMAQALNVIAASCEGYAFPTNLDTDPPIGGMAPLSQAAFTAKALREGISPEAFNAALDAMEAKRRA